jgi:two-component system response regulator YesN
MLYKVFLVEDEIVTREGIRDNVDWHAHGFAFCGEAPDGEMALPAIQSTCPDVLITDIKMPFMDGLQLCKIVRQRWPAIKTIILSGHDEFEYAQQAIELGVTEYLLKPLGAQDLHRALLKLATQLDQERQEQERLRRLRDQVEENRALLRERLLFKLLVGAVSPSDAIEQSLALGMDLAARCYLVTVIRVEPQDHTGRLACAEQQRVQRVVAGLAENNPDVFLLNKDLEESVLIIKGSTFEYVQEERELLLAQIERHVQDSPSLLLVGRGAPTKRLADISRSFADALASSQDAPQRKGGAEGSVDRAELIKVDRSAVEDYLKCGTQEDFDDFFDAFIWPLGDAIKSYMVKNYIVMDIALTAARFVEGLGGIVDQVVPGLEHIETVAAGLDSIDQIREYAQRTLLSAVAFRDSQAGRQHASMIQQARNYVDRHYMDPNISLNEVAAQVNHSPSHFSTVFSQETNTTFKAYLTEVRIRKAKELLRMTNAKSYEVACQVGYTDPHYFSYVFRKHSGLTPTEFRGQTQSEPKMVQEMV